MIDHTSFTQSDDRSRAFQISPTRPRRRSTRANSPKARSASNQWNAWATVTASRERSAIGSASATAATTGTPGTAATNRRRIPSTGSDREHRRARRHEQSRELARSRCEVEHDAAGPEPEVVDQPGHRVGRVRGTNPFVHLGLAAESLLGDLVNGHPAIFAGGSVVPGPVRESFDATPGTAAVPLGRPRRRRSSCRRRRRAGPDARGRAGCR